MSAGTESEAPSPSPVSTGLRYGALFLLIAATLMLPTLTGTTGWPLRLLVILLGLTGAFFWGLRMIFDGRVVLPRGPAVWGGALALATAVVSGLFSDCTQSAVVTLFTWLGYAGAFLLAFWGGSSPSFRRQMIRAVCALALPIAVYGVMQYVVILDLTRAEIEAEGPAIMRQFGGTESDYAAFLQRTIGKRVYATFALPNSLAGFLLIALPLALGLVVAARDKGSRLALAALAAILLLAFFLTFSKGGWLTAALVLLLFLLGIGRRWLRRRWKRGVVLVIGVAIVLSAALTSSPTLHKRVSDMLGEPGGSARVRLDYWTAGFGMWLSRPVLGVGPGNYENHYMNHTVMGAEETKRAHNDYVQLLAECGPLAVVGYLTLWAALLASGFRRRTGSGPPANEPEPAPFPEAVTVVAGLVGILAAGFIGQALDLTANPGLNALILFGFALLWWLAYHVSGRLLDDRADAVLLAALPFALLGFVLHSAIDFDLYVQGIGFVVFGLAGLAAAAWLPRRVLRLRPAHQLAAVIVFSVAALGFFYGARTLCLAGSNRAYGESMLHEGRPDEARTALETACRLNPLDDQAFAALGSCYAAYASSPTDLERSIEHWLRATELNPSYADYHARLGELFRETEKGRYRWIALEFVDRYTRDAPPGGRQELIPALAEYRRAIELAPTQPHYRLAYAKTLWTAGLWDDTRREFREALRINQKMIDRRAPSRQRLSAEQVKTVKEGLDLTPPGRGGIIRQ